MSNKPVDRPGLFYGIKLRHAVALLTCLATILILAGFFSVSAGQKAALETVTSQGQALTETLLSSAGIIIESDKQITQLAIQRLVELVADYDIDQKIPDESKFESLRQALGASKMVLIEKNKVSMSSSDAITTLSNDKIIEWLDSLQIDPDAEVIYEFSTVGESRIFWGYFPITNTLGLFAAIDWKYGQYGNSKLSLYDLLNRVGQETGVEYIMMQNQDGIVFASKKILSMPRLADDQFLVDALKNDTTRSRLMMFQDRQVLECIRKFKSSEFEGVFRVGLSLYGYREIAAGMKRQVWLVVAALIILGMIGFGIVVGFQNFDVLKNSFNKAQIIAQSLLDSIPGPVIAIDHNKIITDINSSARKLFGISAISPVGSEYVKIFADDPFHFNDILSNARGTNFEKILGDNSQRFFITATPLIEKNGVLMGAIAIAQDITDVRRMEEMSESRRRLSELGALAASMAHEVRNPLNAIGITIQRMKSEIKPAEKEEDYARFLDGLKNEIKRLNEIIEKFLAVARSVRPEMAEYDINDLITPTLDLFKGQAALKNIKINSNIKSGLKIYCDKAGITQSLINIIKNSIEAIRSDGKIDVNASDENGKIRISIIDDGPGIADINIAMKPFYTSKMDGTGLGLATASKIVADHGGEMIIESSPGKGCRVDFVLPKKENSK